MGGGMRGLRGRRLVLMLMRWIDGWWLIFLWGEWGFFRFASIFVDDLFLREFEEHSHL
jgi:hypothetical protein